MATPRVPQVVPAEASRADPALTRSLVLLIGAACVVLAAAGIHAAAGIVAPIMLSLVLTIAVLPLFRWARNRGWPSWLATLIALVATYAIVLVLVLGVALAIAKLAEQLPQYADNASKMTGDVKSFLTSHGIGEKPASTVTDQLDPSKLTAALTDVLGAVLEMLGNLFLLVTLLFFFCSAIPLLGPRFATLRRAKPGLGTSLSRFIRATQRYLIMTALFGAIVAVLDTGALWLLGVPLPLVWGLFSFITNFIPNIGFVIGVIPPALLAGVSEGWAKAITVVLVYSCLNVVIQTFIQPHYVGATVGLSAEMTFLSLVVWTFLLGALGALLAVPMTLLVRAIFLDPDARTAWISPLISTTPEPAEE
jgi:predicted PurR-regulated permease PerM